MRLIHGVTALHSGRATMRLTVRQRLVLQRLGIDGELPIATLGERLGLSPSTMTGLTDRLEAAGYVRRRAHPTDRRARRVSLTAKGAAAFAREAAFYRSLLEGTLGALDAPARAQVLRALEMIADRGDATRET